MVNARLDVVFFFEGHRATDDQSLKVMNDVAGVVGNAARRIRGMQAALEDDDVQVWSSASGLRGGAHPGSVAANNDKSFFCHKFMTLSLAFYGMSRCAVAIYG